MKIAVVGAGAIGGLTGALLWDLGCEVTIIGKPEQVAAIKERGFTVDGLLGGKRYDVPASTRLDFNPYIILMAVKTQDLVECCRQVRDHAEGSVVVTMQNGVRCDELAAGVLGRDRIVSSIVLSGATYVEDGHITFNFPGGLILGKPFRTTPDNTMEVIDAARRVLGSAYDIYLTDDIQGTRWTKLLLNLNNAVAGIIGADLQTAFSDERICRLGILLMKEAYDTVAAAGIKLGPLPGLPLDKLGKLMAAPVDISCSIYGSIMRGLSDRPLPGSVLQSIMRGRESEVDYINGEVVGLGQKTGHPTPINERVTELVKQVEKTGKFIGIDDMLKTVLFF